MVILGDTQGTMNPGDIPLSQDYTLGQHQTLTYTAQVEVGSPIVSSTSHPESDNPGLSMVQVRGSSCSARQNTDNIGSIITMLIDDQNVDIEEILTEEQYRQDSQLAGQARTLNQGMGPGQTDIQIKEEMPTLSDHLDHTEYSYTPSEYSFHSRHPTRDWNRADQAGQQHTPVGPTGHCDPHHARQGPMMKQPLAPCSGHEKVNHARDEKYWERRRKNNLAAKKSRDTRRVRENQLRLRVLFLENANKVLREQMDRKEVEFGELRERLMAYEKDQNCQMNP